MKNIKGFTLIELLVVIAIIGILSSVVLASLNTARAKGADAAVKNNLANIRAQAEIVYDNLGNYGVAQNATTCATANTLFATSTVTNMIASAVTAGGGAATCTTAPTSGNATSWAVMVPLKSDANNKWCVDSTGASVQVTGTPISAGDATCN